MKHRKKMMSVVLSCAICVCMLSLYPISVKAAGNCNHNTLESIHSFGGYYSTYKGHAPLSNFVTRCKYCYKLMETGTIYGEYQSHQWTWTAMGDRGDGLYEFDARCMICGYSDFFLSDNPEDPKLP